MDTMRQQDPDYAALARFRHALRKFLVFSEAAAGAAGLTAQQHQVLLAIAGLSQDGALSIGELAEILILRHHSVVELVDRLARLDLVERMADPGDGRRVLVRLSEAGRQKLQTLSETHLKELAAIGPTLSSLLQTFRG